MGESHEVTGKFILIANWGPFIPPIPGAELEGATRPSPRVGARPSMIRNHRRCVKEEFVTVYGVLPAT